MRQGFQAVVFTVGHSTRPLAEFIALLAAHSVRQLIDVRTVPRSRHNPQFNRDTLPTALGVAEIGYARVAGLGGCRHTHPGSPNMGWRNVSFQLRFSRAASAATIIRTSHLYPISTEIHWELSRFPALLPEASRNSMRVPFRRIHCRNQSQRSSRTWISPFSTRTGKVSVGS